MRIAAGELDRRIEIWRAANVDTGFATAPATPTKLATRWARKRDVSDSERVRASEQGQELTSRFLFRSDAVTRTITGKDILKSRGRTYEVTGAKESDEREDGIEITAVTRPDRP